MNSPFPAGGFSRFVPVLAPRFPLDMLLAPYAARLCGHALISVPELLRAGSVGVPTGLPLWIDSGGYALLSDPAAAVTDEADGTGGLRLSGGLNLTPRTVHEAQRGAATAFTLDFPSREGTPEAEQVRRATLSLNNARWALAQPRQGRLFASVQPGHDPLPYLRLNPDGLALGGLAPYSGNRAKLRDEVGRVRAQLPANFPLHVFGIGHPESVGAVMEAGATSVDSSGPQRRAVDGLRWSGEAVSDPAPHERLHLAVLNLKDSADAAGYRA